MWILICFFFNLLTGSVFIVSGRLEYTLENLKKMDDFRSLVFGVYLGCK